MKKQVKSIKKLAGTCIKNLLSKKFSRRHVVPWLLRNTIGHFPEGEAIQQVTKALEKLSCSKNMIIAGPWISEVGFELLYWIPFLRWGITEFNIDPNRLLFLSRGGADPWYQHLKGEYTDIFDLISTQDFQERNQKRWDTDTHQKQFGVSEFDHFLINAITKKLKISEYSILHPSVMYELFKFYWRDTSTIEFLLRHAHYENLEKTDIGTLLQHGTISKEAGNFIQTEIPEKFAAVRFYFRPSFPDTPLNRQCIKNIINNLLKKMPVVLLNPGMEIDDHKDWIPEDRMGGIYYIDKLLSPRTNLAIQTYVLQKAKVFIGTYGGLSYLPGFYGVPSVALYSDLSEFLPVHLDTAHRAFRHLNSSFIPMHVRDLDILTL